jgi:uncharacterized protein (DUF1684 family)
MSALPEGDLLDLMDYKRRVLELYAQVRSSRDAARAWRAWRDGRDELFSSHPQSPLVADGRLSAAPLNYFDYDPALRVLGRVHGADATEYDIPTSGDETMTFTRFATVRFSLGRDSMELELYWLHGYGGGLFLPFRDRTSGRETYGAGRYLLDTVKGSDLGMEGDRLVLDFNFAYNPSCAYDPRWVCPLAPPPNRLDVAIRAGERSGDSP